MSRKSILVYNIILFFNLYFLISLAFSCVYIGLELLKLGAIVDHYSTVAHQKQVIDLITRSMYFSFITLFAVGYGDMTPLGLSKAVAMIQAFIGYILPYAILLNYAIYRPRFKKLNKK